MQMQQIRLYTVKKINDPFRNALQRLTARTEDVIISGVMGHMSILVWKKVRYNLNTFTILEFLKFTIFG